MSRSGLTLAASLITLVAAGSAPAQFRGNGYSQPRVSPYINLLRGGSSPGINYFGLVRPEVENRAAINQVGQLAQQNQQSINGLQNSPTGQLTTGHAFGFQTHYGYFQNLGSGSAGFGLGRQGGGGGLGGGFGNQMQGRNNQAQQRPASRGR